MADAERMVPDFDVYPLVIRRDLLFGGSASRSTALLEGVRQQALPPVADHRVWLPLLDPDDFAQMTSTALAGELHGTHDAVSDVATRDELLNHAAEQSAVELPPAISLDCAELELEPEVFSSWYVSRRVSGERLASRGITPTRRWRQMLDSVWAVAGSTIRHPRRLTIPQAGSQFLIVGIMRNAEQTAATRGPRAHQPVGATITDGTITPLAHGPARG